jgi:23S rRNA-/tRNA-specific pseudouridylate synthase
MNAIQHPIIGDATQESKVQKDKFKLDRIFLHAAKIEFTDLDGKVVSFESPLPEKLGEVLDRLRK